MQRQSLAGLVAEYGRPLPFALLDETQSAEFGEALCWAALNGGSADGVGMAVLRTAARSLAYETVRQHTAARLDGTDSAVVATAVVDTVAALPSRARVWSRRGFWWLAHCARSFTSPRRTSSKKMPRSSVKP